jgi:hypothetical protein
MLSVRVMLFAVNVSSATSLILPWEARKRSIRPIEDFKLNFSTFVPAHLPMRTSWQLVALASFATVKGSSLLARIPKISRLLATRASVIFKGWSKSQLAFFPSFVVGIAYRVNDAEYSFVRIFDHI